MWHERWGEDYDGSGGCVKYTDKVRNKVSMAVRNAAGLHVWRMPRSKLPMGCSMHPKLSPQCSALQQVLGLEGKRLPCGVQRNSRAGSVFTFAQWAERLLEAGGSESWGENWVEDFGSGQVRPCWKAISLQRLLLHVSLPAEAQQQPCGRVTAVPAFRDNLLGFEAN